MKAWEVIPGIRKPLFWIQGKFLKGGNSKEFRKTWFLTLRNFRKALNPFAKGKFKEGPDF